MALEDKIGKSKFGAKIIRSEDDKDPGGKIVKPLVAKFKRYEDNKDPRGGIIPLVAKFKRYEDPERFLDDKKLNEKYVNQLKNESKISIPVPQINSGIK